MTGKPFPWLPEVTFTCIYDTGLQAHLFMGAIRPDKWVDRHIEHMFPIPDVYQYHMDADFWVKEADALSEVLYQKYLTAAFPNPWVQTWTGKHIFVIRSVLRWPQSTMAEWCKMSPRNYSRHEANTGPAKRPVALAVLSAYLMLAGARTRPLSEWAETAPPGYEKELIEVMYIIDSLDTLPKVLKPWRK
jgi:hypothetical protein